MPWITEDASIQNVLNRTAVTVSLLLVDTRGQSQWRLQVCFVRYVQSRCFTGCYYKCLVQKHKSHAFRSHAAFVFWSLGIAWWLPLIAVSFPVVHYSEMYFQVQLDVPVAASIWPVLQHHSDQLVQSQHQWHGHCVRQSFVAVGADFTQDGHTSWVPAAGW